MKTLKEFIIPFKGLKPGEHTYDWDLKYKFFEEAGNTDILDCDLKARLVLNKKERMMELGFLIAGELTVPCDRCLGALTIPVDINESYYIKIGLERREESEEVMIIPESDYQIDVWPLIYDFVSLSIPMKKVHEDDRNGNPTCDQEMLKKLENYKKSGSTDPRWEALKDIELENEN